MDSRLHPRAGVRVTFQYTALSPMLGQTGLPVWWRARKVDFSSFSAQQVGMYGWMRLVHLRLLGRIKRSAIEFWFLMQLAMACGFCTSYPMNWLVDKTWHPDGDVAKRPFGSRIGLDNKYFI